MAVTRLSGGLTPADGADPRTFPAIWNGTADDLEAGDYSKVPTGGAAGEVLAKVSATDYDAAWSLRAVGYPVTPGNSYGLFANTTNAPTLNRLIYHPVWFPYATSIDAVIAEVSTAGSAGAVVRVGVYGVGSDGLPDELLIDAGTADATSTGIKVVTFTPFTVSGLLFAAVVTQVQTCTLRAATTTQFPLFPPGLSSGNSVSTLRYLTESSITGALPANATTVQTLQTVPVAHIRVV